MGMGLLISATAYLRRNALQKLRRTSIQFACSVYQNYNITFFPIAIGAGADNTTLKNISEDCSDGTFFHSSNLSQLISAFNNIAENALSLTRSACKKQLLRA